MIPTEIREKVEGQSSEKVMDAIHWKLANVGIPICIVPTNTDYMHCLLVHTADMFVNKCNDEFKNDGNYQYCIYINT